MKKILSALLMSLVCQMGYADEEILTCEVEECGRFYAGLIGGLNFGSGSCDYDQNTTGMGGLFAGYQFDWNLRLEAEVTYSYVKISKHYYDSFMSLPWRYSVHTKIQAVNFLGNVLYEFPICTNITPYFGVGCGYGWRDSKTSSFFYSIRPAKNNFVWQGIAGLAYHFCDYKFSVDYRRVDFGCNWSDHLMTCSVAKYF